MPNDRIPVITELDAARICELAARMPDRAPGTGALMELLDMVTVEAEIVPGQRIAPDVVTVNSIVSFRDEVTGAVHRVTVVYPRDVSVGERRISLLSPVGRALLGQSVGCKASVELPDGGQREIRLLEIHYQPEAEGQFNI